MDGIASQITAWSEAVNQYIQNNPYDVIQGLNVAVLGLLALLLLLVRAEARAKRRASSLQQQVVELSQQLESLRSEQAAVPEETAQVVSKPEGAPALTVESVISPVAAPPPIEERAPVTVEQPAVTENALVAGLRKSRSGLLSRLAGLFSGRSSLDSSMLDDLEELLILSDVGARCAADLVGEVRKVAEGGAGLDAEGLKGLLKSGILSHLLETPVDHRMYQPTGDPAVFLVVGVNGVGKTTTVAKLASKYTKQGKRVLVIAADTFRAAAAEQLAEWSRRVGFELERGPEGAKPGAVVFDGMARAKQEAFDVVLIDTAGRLHTKANLMQELEGIRNSIRKHIPDAPHETVLVVDGVSGQNALVQAREFNAAVTLTGLVVTKLDGTPKGGIIVAISQELKVPVLFIGVGEKESDLLPFARAEFVDALFEETPCSLGSSSSVTTGAVGGRVANN